MSPNYALRDEARKFAPAPPWVEVGSFWGCYPLKMTRFFRTVLLWQHGRPWRIAWWLTSPHVCDLRHLAQSSRSNTPLDGPGAPEWVQGSDGER